jgi:transposase
MAQPALWREDHDHEQNENGCPAADERDANAPIRAAVVGHRAAASQRSTAQQQSALVAQQAADLKHKQALIDKLTYEMAVLKRLKFATKSEALHADQRSLLEEALEEDLRSVAEEIEQMQPLEQRPQRGKAKRLPLPAHLPRQEFAHEPEATECCGQPMKRIGEDMAEKLDYTPGVFTVHKHVRGKWACACCQTLKQSPVDAHIIDKGIPTTGLLAHVLVAKYADHLPLYRQEAIYARAGAAIPRSTLAQWVGSCGVQLQPLVQALRQEVLQHAGEFLKGWSGTLLVDDFAGYKQLMSEKVLEGGCWAHARRKFFELHAANKSQIAQQALEQIGQIYEIERQLQEASVDERQRIRQQQSRPVVDKLHGWLTEHRAKVPEGSATAKAIDYNLRRWVALTRFVDDGQLPVDNNWVENQIRPVALGRKNWLFAGSLRAGERAAAVMSLIQSAKLNGHDPHAYLKDVMDKLPTWPNSRIGELLPQRWQATQTSKPQA